MDVNVDSQLLASAPAPIKEQPQQQSMNDNAVAMLLARLDEGTQTVMNLRSILTLKTAELNELLAQLELTNQAIATVESTTAQIEAMLKDLGLSNPAKESLLMNAEACLDSAIKSATSIYNNNNVNSKVSFIRRPSTTSTNSNGVDTVSSTEKRASNARLSTTRIRYKPDTKHILRKLDNLLRELELDSGKFFSTIGTTDDYEVLQKAYVDLDIAKTISLSAKSNMKRRNILMRSARRRNNLDEIKTLGEKIREGVTLWKTYTRNAPLLMNGENIIAILDREDSSLAKNSATPTARLSLYDDRSSNSNITPSSSGQTKTVNIRYSLSNESTASSKASRHNRTPSIATKFTETTKESSIPSPVLPATPTAASNKKPYRQSAGPRLTPVKANIGLPRVRTTSVTQHSTKPVTSPISPGKNVSTTIASHVAATNATSVVTNTSSTASQQKKITTPSSSTATGTSDSSAIPDAGKKSLLKPPSQRGPGSTLRLRSMLAKRSSALKPPTVVSNSST
ncbi:hypothetical protein G6F70_001941 [Rhizopus microsporus]|uniref:Uncharacterized protein n=1 Tax=Rhizopus microsporus TaxID=58291 RepID=A0A1X0RNS7_RHIZD|nr:hypothetical protein G6F71_002087 [Rhizopus microsporus]KAG1202798.1 hypothetical protein G6F70_001941 [Rhizopus microsporus]KAG1214431.1 hypothetical protein G6F69_001928 [Rhizopus microsporus]KAG1237108.1 hypothetical protein G6F67_001461 [Rhizopus microsporus]KAG1260955.1 hypothetical protein G6F68_007051 [Rhizopus microsporus]